MSIFVLVIQLVSVSRAMMSRSKSVLLQCLLISYCCFVVGQNSATDGPLAFPETIEDIDRLPIDNRAPLYMQTICKENELYYPGDQLDDWVCDCKPGYIYHGEDKKCYAAFERGPCRAGQQLILAPDGHTPKCERNPCSKPNTTMFGGKCIKIGTPCDVDSRRVYGINEKTIKVECLPVPSVYKRKYSTAAAPVSTTEATRRALPLTKLRERIVETIERVTDPEKRCLPGCQRLLNGECTPIDTKDTSSTQ